MAQRLASPCQCYGDACMHAPPAASRQVAWTMTTLTLTLTLAPERCQVASHVQRPLDGMRAPLPSPPLPASLLNAATAGTDPAAVMAKLSMSNDVMTTRLHAKNSVLKTKSSSSRNAKSSDCRSCACTSYVLQGSRGHGRGRSTQSRQRFQSIGQATRPAGLPARVCGRSAMQGGLRCSSPRSRACMG